MNDNFDLEFETEEDIDAVFNDFFEEYAEEIMLDEQDIAVIDAKRLKEMQVAFAMLKYALKGQKAKLSYELNEPFQSMGSITIEGENIQFDNSEWFSRIYGLSSNAEVYALLNNRVRMTFTFHGLTVSID